MTNDRLINANILLAKLNALATTKPSIFDNQATSHHEWVGKLQALAKRIDSSIELDLSWAVSGLGSVVKSTRDESWGKTVRNFSRLTAELELRISEYDNSSANQGLAFGPGAVYDFFKALSDVIKSAKNTIFIVDPYVDREIFDTYLTSVNAGVSCRLLIRNQVANVRAAAETFTRQNGLSVELRKSNKLHDRLVIIDATECWVLGQSIKDAAAQKPTYLAPLAPDVSKLKLDQYDEIWISASAI